MGKSLPLALAVIFLLLAMLFARASADEGDSVKASTSTTQVGRPVTLDLTVVTPKDATVEVNPTAGSWQSLDVISIGRDVVQQRANYAVHVIRVVVTPFGKGRYQFQPAVTVIRGPDVMPRLLPVTALQVTAVLGPNDPLELSPLASPESVTGAESSLLKPAIGAAIVAAVLLASLLIALGVRSLVRRPARPVEAGALAIAPLEGPIAEAEALMAADPVAAYRALAGAVRGAIASRYGLPAPALTSGELQRRMLASGVDRLEARLVAGLLEECDAVLYGGYRPATARRMQDLGIAQEIVEGAA